MQQNCKFKKQGCQLIKRVRCRVRKPIKITNTGHM